MHIGSTTQRFGQALTLTATLASLVLYGCSAGGNLASLPGTTPVTGATTITQALITDAPNDQVLALGLTINSIRLFDAAGKYADVLTSPTTIEASHLDAVQEPLRAALNIPQGTYTSALITVSSPTVFIVDATTHKPVQATATLTATTDTVTFSTPITVTATSTPICFDLLVAQSVVITGTTAAVTPTFNVTQIPLAQHPTNSGNGRLDDVFGSLTSVTGTSFTLLTASGTQLVIATDTNTTFQDVSGLSALTTGQLLDVDVAQQTSGTLLALRVHLVHATVANELIGPVSAVVGKPATSFTQIARQWVGPGTTATSAGTSYTVNVTGSTAFSTAAQFGSLPTLPFASAFSASTIFAGQNVAVTASTITTRGVTATAVTLIPQTVGGTVTAIASSGGFTVYTVALATGSALGNLTGATSVLVYTNNNTQFVSPTAVIVGSTVRFNGLLFSDGGTLRLLGGFCADHEATAPPQRH